MISLTIPDSLFTGGRMELFESFLRAIAPYVIVVGSFGRNEETEDSDIDCYLPP